MLHRYKRADGVDLTATLYLPPGYDKDRDGALPCLLCAQLSTRLPPCNTHLRAWPLAARASLAVT